MLRTPPYKIITPDYRDGLFCDIFPHYDTGLTMLDRSGNGNDMVIDGCTLEKDSSVGNKQVISFDGADDFATIAHSADFLLDEFTIIMLVKKPLTNMLDSEQVFIKNSLVDVGDEISRSTFEFYLDSSERVRFKTWGDTLEEDNVDISSYHTIGDSGYYLLAWELDSVSCRAYSNGLLVKTDSSDNTNILFSADYDLIFSIDPLDFNSPYSGSIALFRIYNKALGMENLTKINKHIYAKFGMLPLI